MLTNEIWFPPLKGAFNERDRCLYLAGFRLWGSESPDVMRHRPPARHRHASERDRRCEVRAPRRAAPL
ncbi:MAG: hypothetical protein R3F11_05565 [Verrucomicrobiales bacterium]